MTTIDPATLADLTDGTLSGPEWEVLLASNPEAAAEVELARRVRLVLLRLQQAEVALPAGFEARLMARVRQDRTLLDMIELLLNGVGRALVDLLNLLLNLLTPPRGEAVA